MSFFTPLLRNVLFEKEQDTQSNSLILLVGLTMKTQVLFTLTTSELRM